MGTKPKTIPHKRGSIIFFLLFLISYSQLLHRDYFLCQHLHQLQQKETLRENS